MSGNEFGSAPNLSTCIDDIEEDIPRQINLRQRKRKERTTNEQEYKQDFKIFERKIMKFLENFGMAQNETLQIIREEISQVKDDMKTIKAVTETYSQQFTQINTELENIKTNNKNTSEKIRGIEEEIQKIKNQQHSDKSGQTNFNPLPPPSPFVNHENLILELKDRCDREKNIVVAGVTEKNDKSFRERQNHDSEEITKMLVLLNENCPRPIKTLRLGKYTPGKNRPIKVTFTSNDTPKLLLRNKAKLPENIQIYSDQTPTQQRYLKSLKEELKRRLETGEKDLIIRYLRGVPRIIVNTDQKNV